MSRELVLRNGLKIIATPGSGTGDPQLTLDATTKEVGQIPAVDSSVFLGKALTTGYIYIGDNSNLAVAVLVTGDFTLSSGGVATLSAGAVFNNNVNTTAGIVYSKLVLTNSILDADINTLAAITRTKIASGTANRLLINNGSGVFSEASAVLGNRLLVSDASGIPTHSAVTDAEAAFLSGVTSAIQTQISNRLSFSSAITVANGDMIYYNGAQWINVAIGTVGQLLSSNGSIPVWTTTIPNSVPTGGTTGQYLNKIDGTNYNTQWSTLTLSKITDVTATFTEINKLTGATWSTVESNYLTGVVGNIQGQLNNKLDSSLAYNSIWVGNIANQPIQLAPGTSGYVLTSVSGVPQWQPSSGGGGGGGITGPGTSTNNAIVRWNGTLGTAVFDSLVVVDNLGVMTGGTWNGNKVGLAYGGTNADLSATGGAGQYLRQLTTGAAITVAIIPASDIGSGQALTKVDDTNVTLALGGTPATALLKTASLTLGWTGTLGVARGGTNIASYAVGDLLYASGATTLSKLADVAVGSYLRSGGVTTAPVWSTVTIPNTTAVGDLWQGTTTNIITALSAVATGNALISGGVTTASSWGKIGLTTHISGILAGANGGTGVNNGASLITIGGNLTFSGAFNTTFVVAGSNTHTLPNRAGTLADDTDLATKETLLNEPAFASALKFEKNYTMNQVIAGAIAFTLNGTPTPKNGRTNKIYLKADGTNKPTFSSDFVVMEDNWVNTINTWNLVYCEYTASTKISVWLTYQ